MSDTTTVYEGRTSNGPCKVYITPDRTFKHNVSVAILYIASSIGSFANEDDFFKHFNLEQTLKGTNEEALSWATQWLTETFGSNPDLRLVG